jgi:hypothetical protein
VRARRVIRWTLLSLLALLAIAAGAATVALRSLDRPWMKRRLQSLLSAKAGVSADWSATRLRLLSGLHIEDLKVASPPGFRARAPSLLQVSSLDVSWTTASLRGNGPPLTTLRADGLAITIVRDENGRSSLDALGAPAPQALAPSPAPAQPLSHLLRDLLSSSPVFTGADLEHVSLALITPKAGYRLGGISLQAAYARDAAGWSIEAHLGHKSAPLEVEVTRSTGGTARAHLSAEARVTTGNATLQLDAEVLEQTLLPKVRLKNLLHLEADAAFDPKTRKVAIAVKNSTAADGAATIDASLELPDNGPSLVDHAEGELDAARVLQLVPADLVPVQVHGVQLGYRMEKLLLDRKPRLLPGGGVVVVGQAKAVAAPSLAARGLNLTVDGKPDKEGGARLHIGVQLDSLDTGTLKAQAASFTILTRELHLDIAEPLATRGHLTVEGHAAGLAALQKKSRLALSETRFNLSARLLGRPPYNIEADIPIGELLFESKKRILAQGPAHLTLHATEVLPESPHPERSRARVRLEATLGPVALTLDADKQPESVGYQLTAKAGSLAPLRPFVATFQPAWDRTSLVLSSAGKVEQLFAAQPRVTHKSELSGDNLSFGDSTIKLLKLSSSSNGTAGKHSGELAFSLQKATVAGGEIAQAAAKIVFDYDLAAPKLSLALTTDGGGGQAQAAFDRGRRALRLDLDGKLSGLSALAPFLAPAGLVDLQTFVVGLSAHVSVLGVVGDVDGSGTPRLVAEPLKTLTVEGPVELELGRLHWQKGDRELEVPQAKWALAFTSDGDRRSLHSSVALSKLDYAAGDVEIVVHDLDDELDTTIGGDLRLGVGSVDHRLSVRSIEQEIEAGYPLGGVTLDVHARRDADGVVHVSELRLANQAAGTAIALKGGFDAGAERRTMTLTGELRQDLAQLWSDAHELSGRGQALLELRVESGNLRLYHAQGALRLSGVDLQAPHAGYSVTALEGEIPLSSDLLYDRKGGLRLLRATPLNAYSELRFSDQSPLLRRQSFITLQRLETPLGALGPLAGNLRVENNLFALNQFEAGVSGGRLTGQCIVDWQKSGSAVHLHLRASRVASSHGEPFDGNAAVELSLKDRSLEGRAEILRIGRRHLLDLLDLHDPHRGDPAANKVRRALALGYPDQVRLAFSHGFANAKVTFGGLARLIRIDELRGIPMGPIIDKVLAPLEAREEEQ